jgi:hypothetical protein
LGTVQDQKAQKQFDEMIDEETGRPYRNSSARFKKRDLDGSKPLWYRQPRESIQAYEAFMVYLTMPREERSFQKTGDALGKGYSCMAKWAQQWSWTLRAASYEEHYLLLRLESFEADRDEMWVRHKALAHTALTLIDAKFSQMVTALGPEGKGDPGIKPDALVRLLDVATKVERMSMLGRIAASEEISEREEKMAERFSDELVQLIREIKNESGLSKDQQDQIDQVLKRHLTGGKQEDE